MKGSHTKDKGDIRLEREELAPGGTSLWMKWYYPNISFTYVESQVQLGLVVFERFSVERWNQWEN